MPKDANITLLVSEHLKNVLSYIKNGILCTLLTGSGLDVLLFS